jgi:hypothetical protein
MALDSGILAGMTEVGGGMTLGKVVPAGMPQDKVVPAEMPGPSARDGERAGKTEALVLDSALPSMALDSGIPAGMTAVGG